MLASTQLFDNFNLFVDISTFPGSLLFSTAASASEVLKRCAAVVAEQKVAEQKVAEQKVAEQKKNSQSQMKDARGSQQHNLFINGDWLMNPETHSTISRSKTSSSRKKVVNNLQCNC